MLVNTDGSLVFTTTAKQVAQRKVQLGCIGVLLYGLDESVNRLVLLLIEQVVEAFEIGLRRLSIFKAQLAQIQQQQAAVGKANAMQASLRETQAKLQAARTAKAALVAEMLKGGEALDAV